jgi:putative ABC transport system permease protein
VRRGPVARAVRGGVTRRRVQTTVIGLVLLVSTAASVLALALVVDSRSPFDSAFITQRGADLAATVNTARATPAQLAATKRLSGVTAAAGPFAEVTVNGQLIGPMGGKISLPQLTLAGRPSGGGRVDDVTLQSGHWATRPGQVVIDSSPGPGESMMLPPDAKITLTSLPGKPTLTVVGTGSSVTGTAGGWVTPGELARLRTSTSPDTAQMLYRFASSATAADIRADEKAVSAALPAGAVTGTQSYLTIASQEKSGIAPFVPFLVAFGVIGLVMSVLIVANVVSGAVVSGYRRIGILKSIGFSPGQVVAAYAGQVSVPAIVGIGIGVVLGNVLSIPLLAQTANAFGVGALGVPLWVDLTVAAVMALLVGLAALGPSLRAGRLSAVQAIALGRAPRTGRGYAAHRLLGRVRLPRPVTMGLAAPFARPARTSLTLAAVLLGAITVTFAVGLSTSLSRVVTGLSRDTSEQVQVQVAGVGGPGSGVIIQKSGHVPTPAHALNPPSAATVEREVSAAVRAVPGTRHYVGEMDSTVSVAGMSQQAQLTAFDGNASWTGYELISGHWFTRPGQAVVPTGFLTATGKAVGDTVDIGFHGRQFPVRIVGQVFETDNNGVDLLTSWQTLRAADPGLAPSQYDISLRPGTSAQTYAQALGTRLGQAYFVQANSRNSTTLTLMQGLIGTLTLMLAVVAGLGVLNTVVLSTRERVHDLGVFKAVGMTPRQTIAMVVCWVAGTGLIAGLIAVPAGDVLHRYILPAMANAANTGLPAVIINAYSGWELGILALSGLAIAVVGALLPASWAAGTRTATALHTE